MKKAAVEFAITQSQLKAPVFVRYGVIMGKNSRRGPVDHFLNGTEADMESENGGTEIPNRASTVSLISGHLGDNRRKTRSVSAPIFPGKYGLVDLAAMSALSFIKNEVEDIGLDLGKLDPLMRIIRGEAGETGGAARRAGLRLESLRFRRFQENLPVSLVALLSSGPALLLPGRLPLERLVGRRWFAGIGRVAVELGFQLLNALSQKGYLFDQRRQKCENLRRSIRQVLLCDIEFGKQTGFGHRTLSPIN